MAKQVSSLSVGLFATVAPFAAGMKAGERAEQSFIDKTLSVGSALLGMTGVAGFVGSALGSVFAVGKGIDLAAQFQTADVQLSALTGSAQTASAMLADLRAYAAASPFAFPELQDASKRLLAVGVNAQGVVPLLKEIGDVAAGTGTGIGEIADQFTRTAAEGKLGSRELLEFGRQGIPVVQALAERFHTTTQGVAEMAEAGRLGFADLKGAFDTLTGPAGKFGGIVETQGRTIGGVLHTLSATVDNTLADVAQRVLTGFNIAPLIGRVSSVVPRVGNALIAGLDAVGPSIYGWVATAADAFTGLYDRAVPIFQSVARGIAAAWAPVSAFVQVHASAIGVAFAALGGALAAASIPALLGTIGTAVGFVGALLSPVLVPLAGLASVAGLVGAALGVLALRFDLIGTASRVIGTAAAYVAANWQGMVATTLAAGTAVYGAVSRAFNGVLSVMVDVWSGVQATWGAATDYIATHGQVVRAVFEGIGGAITAAAIPTVLSVVGGAFVALGSAIAPLAAVLTVPVAATLALGTALVALAMRFDLIGAAAAVLGEVTSYVSANWQAMLATTIAAGLAIYDVAAGAFTGIANVAGAVWSAVTSVVATAWEAIGGSSIAGGLTVGGVFAKVGSLASGFLDVVLASLDAAGYVFTHLGDTAALVGITIADAVVTAANQVRYAFGTVIPTVVSWAATNFVKLVADMFHTAEAYFTNGIGNIVRVVTNLPGLIRGTVDWSDVWHPLTEGLTTTLDSLPNIPERIKGQMEQGLDATKATLTNSLGAGIGEAITKRQAEAAAAAKAIGDKVGGAFGGATTKQMAGAGDAAKKINTTIAGAFGTKPPDLAKPVIPQPDPLKVDTSLNPSSLALAVTPEVKRAKIMRSGSAESLANRAYQPPVASLAAQPAAPQMPAFAPVQPAAVSVTTPPATAPGPLAGIVMALSGLASGVAGMAAPTPVLAPGPAAVARVVTPAPAVYRPPAPAAVSVAGPVVNTGVNVAPAAPPNVVMPPLSVPPASLTNVVTPSPAFTVVPPAARVPATNLTNVVQPAAVTNLVAPAVTPAVNVATPQPEPARGRTAGPGTLLGQMGRMVPPGSMFGHAAAPMAAVAPAPSPIVVAGAASPPSPVVPPSVSVNPLTNVTAPPVRVPAATLTNVLAPAVNVQPAASPGVNVSPTATVLPPAVQVQPAALTNVVTPSPAATVVPPAVNVSPTSLTNVVRPTPVSVAQTAQVMPPAVQVSPATLTNVVAPMPVAPTPSPTIRVAPAGLTNVVRPTPVTVSPLTHVVPPAVQVPPTRLANVASPPARLPGPALSPARQTASSAYADYQRAVAAARRTNDQGPAASASQAHVRDALTAWRGDQSAVTSPVQPAAAVTVRTPQPLPPTVNVSPAATMPAPAPLPVPAMATVPAAPTVQPPTVQPIAASIPAADSARSAGKSADALAADAIRSGNVYLDRIEQNTRTQATNAVQTASF